MSETVDSLKQRLVGALVILSLAVIFLPMIFDKPHHNEDRATVVPVPPKPEFKTFEIAKPVKPEYKVLELDGDSGKVREGLQIVPAKPEESVVAKIVNAEIVSAKEDVTSSENSQSVTKESGDVSKPKVKTPENTNKVSKPVEVKRVASKPKVSHLPAFKNVWMVQLGTFGNKTNAYRLRDQLRADGFDGHTKQVKLNGKTAIRVFTGPFVKKREAEKIKKRVDQKYKVDSRLIKFDA